jgi:hypothetical protein
MYDPAMDTESYPLTALTCQIGETTIEELWHPGSERPEHPVFQPRDQVFWNTALLGIEQISSLLQI